jgi:hypothetical protein
MGGSAVSVTNGVINIASVTGNIVITAVAEVSAPSYTNLFVPSAALINKRINSSGTAVERTGYAVTNSIDISGRIPFAENTKIYIKGATFAADSDSKVIIYNTTGTSYTGAYHATNGGGLTLTNEGNGVVSFTVKQLSAGLTSSAKRLIMCLKVSDSEITANDIKDIVITIDEPIQ